MAAGIDNQSAVAGKLGLAAGEGQFVKRVVVVIAFEDGSRSKETNETGLTTASTRLHLVYYVHVAAPCSRTHRRHATEPAAIAP